MGILSLIGGIPAKAWGYVILLAALGGCGLYLHHRWYTAGYNAQAAKVEALQARVMALQSSGQACSSALANASAAADMAKAQSDEKMKMAAKLVSQLGREAVAAQTALADAQERLKQAAQSKDCATTASMKLCSAMQNY